MKKTTAIVLIVTLLCIFCLSLSACSSDPIVGTWKSELGDVITLNTKGKADGTISLYNGGKITLSHWEVDKDGHYRVYFLNRSQTTLCIFEYNPETDTLKAGYTSQSILGWTWTRVTD